MRQTHEEFFNQGFDDTTSDEDGFAHVACSQCQAAMICGVPCHETGCPNMRHECRECCALIPVRQRVCEDCAEEGL